MMPSSHYSLLVVTSFPLTCWCCTYRSMGSHSQVVHPVISASSKTLTFYNKDTRGEIQRASFNEEQVKRVFHGSFHKVDTTH